MKTIKYEPKLDVVKAPEVLRYRYFCDACTKIAFWANDVVAGLVKTCKECGKELTTKKENYIKD
jgi:rRNA maturation endonuclease Nob1